MTDWETKKLDLINALSDKGTDHEKKTYLDANAKAIDGVLAGRGPDDATATAAGAVMVANISSAHLPAFCQASRRGDPKPYKNTYDLKRNFVGDGSRRAQVDEALPITFAYRDAYFGAVAVTGAGIRFYGDICLVLKPAITPLKTTIMDRNSYDLIRSPLKEQIGGSTTRRSNAAKELKGQWSKDLAAMGTIKVLERIPTISRRLTTGQIAATILDDEDYIEVVREGSFGAKDLLEARTSAADATLEERLERRLQSGPAPSATDLLWLSRRREAERQLRSSGIALSVVVTPGRVT